MMSDNTEPQTNVLDMVVPIPGEQRELHISLSVRDVCRVTPPEPPRPKPPHAKQLVLPGVLSPFDGREDLALLYELWPKLPYPRPTGQSPWFDRQIRTTELRKGLEHRLRRHCPLAKEIVRRMMKAPHGHDLPAKLSGRKIAWYLHIMRRRARATLPEKAVLEDSNDSRNVYWRWRRHEQ